MFIKTITCLLLFLVLAYPGLSLAALTLIVNNTADLDDASPGNGVCDVGDGSCSFRAAVQEANASLGKDTIILQSGTFNITQTYTNSSGTFGEPVDILSPMDIVGQGQGESLLYTDQAAFTQTVPIEIIVTGSVKFSDLTLEFQNPGLGVTISISACSPCTFEDVEILGGGGAANVQGVMDIADTGETILRRVTMSNTRIGAFISRIPSGGLLIEDSLLDGNHVVATAIGTGYGPLTLRRTTVRNLALFNENSGAVFANLNAHPITIEDSEFDDVPRVLRVRNFGNNVPLTVSGSLVTNTSSAAFVLEGPLNGSIVNSTISGAATGLLVQMPTGGSGQVDLLLNNITITGATTSVSVAGGAGTLTAQNSIIANGATECVGSLNSAGYNLIEGPCTLTGDSTGNIIATDPLLGPLADNGGPTRTHALGAGSPAIDAGNPVVAEAESCEVADQRGAPRFDGACDSGAFEYGGCPLLELSAYTVTAFEAYEECHISVGPNVTVEGPSGDLLLTTGSSVTVTGDFMVETGGSLTIVINPDLQVVTAYEAAIEAGWLPQPDL